MQIGLRSDLASVAYRIPIYWNTMNRVLLKGICFENMYMHTSVLVQSKSTSRFSFEK